MNKVETVGDILDSMAITYHKDFEQGSPEWVAIRCGIITASEVDKILTPTLKVASNDKERQYLYELMAQRINGQTEPQYVSDSMLRGKDDEIYAREMYIENYGPVHDCAFVETNALGFRFGYSPDGLVGDEGLIEIKSRAAKYQVQTILDGILPAEFALQIQSGLLITGRKWCDFISYSNGMPMFVLRVLPNPETQAAITAAVTEFEARIVERLTTYSVNAAKFHKAPRREYQEILA